MGASGWDYRVEYAGSLQQSLALEQQKILDDGDFIWPWDDYNQDYLEGPPRPRPTTLAELSVAKNDEVFWEQGTHTLLDIDRIWQPSDEHEIGAIQPLSSDEVRDLYGTEQPSAGDIADLDGRWSEGSLFDLLGDRWSGRSLVLYADGRPAEVLFWGWSGD